MESRQPTRSNCRRGRCCVAAGTSPNITYEKESPGTFRLDDAPALLPPAPGRRSATDGTLAPRARPAAASSPPTSDDGRFVSYYGDNHPRYAGNVVKAMASAKHGYPHVAALFDAGQRCGRCRDPGRSADARLARAGGARWTTSSPPRVVEVEPPHADDHRGDRARAGGGPPLPPGPVLPAAELRIGRGPAGVDGERCRC